MGAVAQASARLIIGNWKMNGEPSRLGEALRLAAAIDGLDDVLVALCPPATLLARLSTVLAGTRVITGGQDCHAEPSGAFTGEISAPMLAEAGARLVIVGHCERRIGQGETDALIARKAVAATVSGLTPIICVGETLAQHEAGTTLDVVRRQLDAIPPAIVKGGAFAIAYEPVWAIGARASASAGHIATLHRFIRACLDQAGATATKAPILYGGSVTAASAPDILATPEVGGLLVGGASLKAETFAPIIACAAGSREASSTQPFQSGRATN